MNRGKNLLKSGLKRGLLGAASGTARASFFSVLGSYNIIKGGSYAPPENWFKKIDFNKILDLGY